MKFEKGQTLYMEHHNMCTAWEKGKKDPTMMDGPSYILYGTVTEVDEDGKGILTLTREIGVDGNDIPFEPRIPGHDDRLRLDPDNFVLNFVVFDSKEKAQECCDERNKVQLANWLALKIYDNRIKRLIGIYAEQNAINLQG